MMRERVSISELTEALRRQGCTDINNGRVAILENDGNITVVKRRDRV